jgi:hypothetical protein
MQLVVRVEPHLHVAHECDRQPEKAERVDSTNQTEGIDRNAFARTTTDADDLNTRINNLQNSISVAGAQKAVKAINQLIIARDFLGASDALDGAIRAWNQTQQGTYPPFDNLRLTIQAAVELSQGREIARFDPKADVVNAFIKNARDALADGRLADAAQNVRDALAVRRITARPRCSSSRSRSRPTRRGSRRTPPRRSRPT